MPPPPLVIGRVHNFIGDRIAIYKPRKHRYYLMSWTGNYWDYVDRPVQNELPIKKHKTDLHIPSTVNIRVRYNTYITVCASCEYLRIDEHDIPIVKRIGGGTVPLSVSKHDFNNIYIDHDTYMRNVELWTIPESPNPPPSISLKSLPRRIAWILAEDAGKNGDKCSITMELISPITAAVTTCFHCFEHEAIQTWMERHTTCPQCRDPCVFTKAYED